MPEGDFSRARFWFSYLAQETIFVKMINLFLRAFASKQEIDVTLVLGAIKCGLYSRDEATAKLCLELLLKTVETLKKNPIENADPADKFAAWFTKIVKQPQDSVLHNSVL